MSDHLRQQITQLFKAFYPEHAERWEYLLEHDQRRWYKMASFKHWFTLDQTACSPKNLDLSHPMLSGKGGQPVVALCCRWDRPWLKEMTLDEAYQSIHEGYISVTPGKLGLAVNHEGGYWLLHK
jgi:hypothetical protein